MRTKITDTEIVHYFDDYSSKEETRQKIKEMREENKTYAQIGKELGLSRQRVHQIAKENKQAEREYFNHDATHCFDYNSSCPKSCYRAKLTKDLKKINYLLPTSWSHFKGTKECPKTKENNMRLIDADKLTKDLIENKSFYPAIVKRAIEEAPTVQVMGEWISVEERLPNAYQEVIVYEVNMEFSILTYQGNNEWRTEQGMTIETEDGIITHWMPLPQPPQMKGE